VFNHPPYSPDLAPSDFHLFLHLKKFNQRIKDISTDSMLCARLAEVGHKVIRRLYQ
jgi:hypothetical protein